MRIRSTGPTKETILVRQGSIPYQGYRRVQATCPSGIGSSYNLLGLTGVIKADPPPDGMGIYKFGSGYQIQSGLALEFAKRAAAADAEQRLPASSPMYYTYDYTEMRDVVVPNFRARQVAGEIINNPMTQIASAYVSSPVPVSIVNLTFIRVENKDISEKTAGTLTITVDYSYEANLTSQMLGLTHHESIIADLLASHSPAHDAAVIGAFAKLQQAELDVAMMAVEAGETLKYLGVLVMRAAKMLNAITHPVKVWQYAVKTAKKCSVRERANHLAEAYLEARYALRPLIMDIEDILKYVSGGRVMSKQDRYTYRKNEPEEFFGTRTVMVGSQPVTVQYAVRTSARAGVLAQLGLEVPGSSFGFMNFASLAWEKVKYSFILGWLVDIGGLLYTLNPNVALKPLTSWCTDRTTITYYATMTVQTPAGTKTTTSSGSYHLVSRVPIEGNRPPLVTIAVNFDGFKMLDLLALASQFQKR